jgi:hypothetical protein
MGRWDLVTRRMFFQMPRKFNQYFLYHKQMFLAYLVKDKNKQLLLASLKTVYVHSWPVF